MENLGIVQAIQELAPIAEEEGLKLKGCIQVFVKRAKTGIEELLFEQDNVIDTLLKDQMRDTMHSTVDFALDNLQATQVKQADMDAGLNGKDGLLVFGSVTRTIPNALGFMASAVHPTDASGNYYRQWQGVYQNLTGGTETAKAAEMGNVYTHSGGGAFDTIYAYNITFSEVTLLNNDIITINWKISVG